MSETLTSMAPPPASPWLHREGSWVLLETSRCGPSMWGYNHQSLIWHQCQSPLRKDRSTFPSGHDYEGCWRLSGRSLSRPCGVCLEVCPPEIQALWRFHNWETMDSDYTYTSFYHPFP